MLDLVELYDGLSDFGLTDDQIQTIFFDLDVNSYGRLGRVSKEEFLRGYATFYPHKQGNTNDSGQTGADQESEPPPADAAVPLAQEEADAVPVEEEAPPVEKGMETDQQLAAKVRSWKTKMLSSKRR